MIINDLSHLETVLENENVQGGISFADAKVYAFASGKNISITNIEVITSAVSDKSSTSSSYGVASSAAS